MTATPENALPVAVAEFLDRIGTGDWEGMEDHLDRDVLYDAAVPGWHYQYEGADRVLREYREEWSGRYLWTIVERHSVADGDNVMVLIEMHGVPVRAGEHPPAVCRLSNLFRLDRGCITEHRYTCCGQWDPETVGRIAGHAPRVEARPV